MSKKLNLALIGAGRIGKLHAETIAFRIPEATLTAITDVRRDAAEAAVRRGVEPPPGAEVEEGLAGSGEQDRCSWQRNDTDAALTLAHATGRRERPGRERPTTLTTTRL